MNKGVNDVPFELLELLMAIALLHVPLLLALWLGAMSTWWNMRKRRKRERFNEAHRVADAFIEAYRTHHAETQTFRAVRRTDTDPRGIPSKRGRHRS